MMDLNDMQVSVILKALQFNQSFGVLTDKVVDIYTERFGIDCRALCDKYGITYELTEHPTPPHDRPLHSAPG